MGSGVEGWGSTGRSWHRQELALGVGFLAPRAALGQLGLMAGTALSLPGPAWCM